MVTRDSLFSQGKQVKQQEEEEFDPDQFLDTLEQQYRNPSPPRTLQCPLHPQYSLEKRESHTDYGQWEYYKCPFQDCFVCCGVDNADYYLQSARSQIEPYYTRMPLDKMKCYCDRHLYMSMSHSDKNPGRLYLKCPKRYCDFFQWVDTPPRGKTRAHLESPRREGYPRPPQLFRPQPREEWQRVDALCQERKKKRSGGMVNDGMGPFEGNWDQAEYTPKERLYIGQMKPAEWPISTLAWKRGFLFSMSRQDDLKTPGSDLFRSVFQRWRWYATTFVSFWT